MHLVSCTNTHREVTDLVNHRMVKNTKTSFLQEFLIYAWHILRSYCFVAEVTFKEKQEFDNRIKLCCVILNG